MWLGLGQKELFCNKISFQQIIFANSPPLVEGTRLVTGVPWVQEEYIDCCSSDTVLDCEIWCWL